MTVLLLQIEGLLMTTEGSMILLTVDHNNTSPTLSHIFTPAMLLFM